MSSVTLNATGELRVEVEMLREQLALLKDERDNLRTERDRLLGGDRDAGPAGEAPDRSAAGQAAEVVAVG